MSLSGDAAPVAGAAHQCGVPCPRDCWVGPVDGVQLEGFLNLGCVAVLNGLICLT